MGNELETESDRAGLSLWKRWRRQSWKRRFIGYALSIFLLIALFYIVENVRGDMALRDAKRRAADAGMELDFLKLMTRELPPPEKNFGAVLPEIEAIGNFRSLDPEFRGAVRLEHHHGSSRFRGMQYADTVNHALFFHPAKSSHYEGSTEILKLLDQWKHELEKISEASVRPNCVFDFDWSASPMDVAYPQCFRAARVLILKATAELGVGDSSSAISEIETLQRMRCHFAKSSLLINAFVQARVEHMLAQFLWDGLNKRRFNESELSRLSDLCSEVDFISLWDGACHREMAFSLTVLQKAVGNPVKRSEATQEWFGLNYIPRDGLPDSKWSDGISDFADRAIAISIPYGWFQQWSALKITNNVESLTTMPSMREKYNAMRSADSANPYMFVWGARAPTSLDHAMELFISAMAINKLAKTAIAFELYFLKYEKYPAAFNEVIPEFLDAVPIDPWTDKPLLLDFRADGRLVIYSIGQDLIDDGGIPQSRSSKVGDVVWHYSLPAGFDVEKHFDK